MLKKVKIDRQKISKRQKGTKILVFPKTPRDGYFMKDEEYLRDIERGTYNLH